MLWSRRGEGCGSCTKNFYREPWICRWIYDETAEWKNSHLKMRSQFLADMAMMMGGYAAEEIIFGDVSTGASSDLKEATELARRL